MNRVKDEWDSVYRATPLAEIPWHAGSPDAVLVELVEKGQISKGKVMDLCSGDGTNSIYLASLGFDVSGVDISPAAVKIAKKRCAGKGADCKYKSGDVLKFRIREKYDFILDRGCFHHIPPGKKPEYVKRTLELLNDRGKMLLYCFSDRNKGNPKALSKEDVEGYFGKYYRIKCFRETVHTEPDGHRVYLLSVFMEMI